MDRLGPDFQLSQMLVVDLLHEFELGVWKTVFSHLIRLLYAADAGSDKLVLELDSRLVLFIYFSHTTALDFNIFLF